MSAFNARLNYLFNNYYNQIATQQEKDELFQIIQAGNLDRFALSRCQGWQQHGCQDRNDSNHDQQFY